ncbi:Dyp-type peroxidase [Karstenula rhodostoma CBS 690.94]|uniref:Dyp-type peroxidase n=1 Tax=Karstenula rhodostoma CBS 690.94 TaxID=1392251 RepID=A0A9P4UI22_9PLEO|nr:Dyp-type peroxidase [Karstenula rhodostoma CBS 690.94]
MADGDFKLSNVQGDIIVGLSKKTEIFFFFRVVNGTAFRTQLKNLVPLITTADQATGERTAIRAFKAARAGGANGVDGQTTLGEITENAPLLSVVGVNIAFSQKGLIALGIQDDLKDPLFTAGQRGDAFDLADKGTGNTKENFKPDWDAAFLQEQQAIHGVVLVAGDSFESVNGKLEEVKAILSAKGTSSIAEVATLAGDVRPGEFKGHEHFGFLDGISQPALKGVDNVGGKKPLPGQSLVDLGVALLGRSGDTVKGRASWAKDGSFLAFRKLPQFVPEFDRFLEEKSKPISDDFDDAPTPADILGARMMGRWKSGAPLRITPFVDNPVLAADPQRNNKFKFNPKSQEMCPFSAHVRKMNPRKDLDQFATASIPDPVAPHMILRRGIPFGPEVTTEEKLTKSTRYERGLYFVSYQSNLSQGFSFLQKRWANEKTFPPQEPVEPGFDPIIGQAHDEVRVMTGANDDNTNEPLRLDRQWVQSKGGEYFFSPSIEALNHVLSSVAAP